VNVFHVEVVSRDGVGNRVLSEDLGLFSGVSAREGMSKEGEPGREDSLRCHQFRVEFDGVVTEFGDCNGFQTLTALRKVRVTLDPSGRNTRPSVRARKKLREKGTNRKQSM
jgi:hypothetical protein